MFSAAIDLLVVLVLLIPLSLTLRFRRALQELLAVELPAMAGQAESDCNSGMEAARSVYLGFVAISIWLPIWRILQMGRVTFPQAEALLPLGALAFLTIFAVVGYRSHAALMTAQVARDGDARQGDRASSASEAPNNPRISATTSASAR